MAHDEGRFDLPDGYALHRFDRLDGTNAEALRRMARGEAPPGAVFVARVQDAGRGRAGRTWQSPAGNLHATIVLSVERGRSPAHLAFVAALGTLDALRRMAPSGSFALKWPNDVLCGGRKLSGVLIEAGETAWAVGVGINLAASPPDDAVRHPATNLKSATGADIPAAEALGALCAGIEAWRRRWTDEGFGPLREAWLASAHGIGDTIAASTGRGTVAGRFAGLDADGALLIDVAGARRLVSAGDVFFPGDA